MQEKNFISYEYSTKTVKAKDQTKAIDMYEAFGWEVTSTAPTLVDGVTLSLKRDRKLKHKQELTRLERQAENVFETINGCTVQKQWAQVFLPTFSVASPRSFSAAECVLQC